MTYRTPRSSTRYFREAPIFPSSTPRARCSSRMTRRRAFSSNSMPSGRSVVLFVPQLRPLPDQPVDDEQDDRADYGSDEARGFARPVPADRLTDEIGEERTRYSQEGRHDQAQLVVARMQRTGDHADDESDNRHPHVAHLVL